MKWTEQRPEAVPRPIADVLARMAPLDAIELARAQRYGPLVVLDPECRTRIMQHLESRNTELGGLLIGWPYVGRVRQPLVTIHHCVPSLSFRSSNVSLAMNSDVWEDARRHVGPELGMVVGWYHSHPNLGAFFSGTDRRTQRGFFRQPYSLGLVIDPIRRQEAWFVGPESVPVPVAACIASGAVRTASSSQTSVHRR